MSFSGLAHQVDMTRRFNQRIGKLEDELRNFPDEKLECIQRENQMRWYHTAAFLAIGAYQGRAARYEAATKILEERQGSE